MPKSKYLNRFAFRTLKRKTSKRGTRSDACPRLSLATSTSAITDEQSFSVIHADTTWRCVTSPTDEKELVDSLNTADVIPSKSTSQSASPTWVHKNVVMTLQIPNTPFYMLTEAEIVTLQKLAVICLRAADFGCNIIIPREFPCSPSATSGEGGRKFPCGAGINNRWNNLRKSSAATSKNHENVSKIFGVSLGTLVRNQDKENFPVPSLEPLPTDPINLQDDSEPNDSTTPLGRKSGVNAINQMAEKEHIAKLKDFLTNDPPETLGKAVFISSSIGNIAAPNTFAVRKMSQIAIDTSPSGGADFRARGPSFSSIYSILARSASSLVDALTLSHETNSSSAGVVNSGSLASSREAMLQSESLKYAVPNEPCVPTFVKTCVNWIKEHDGLKTLGIFRIAGSQKRIKNLRESFEIFGEQNWPDEESATVHDVAAMMKQFLRELPDGLLSKELYHPLIATTKIEDVKTQLKCLKYLLCLLPRASRDTLKFILSFLHEIHSATLSDQIPNSSPEMSGSKMNAANLATVFGPTIMKPPSSSSTSRNSPCGGGGPGGADIGVEKMEYIEDYTPIVNITKTLILCHEQLFQLDGATTSKILQIIQENNPEATDFIINQRYSKHAMKRQLSADQHHTSPTKEPMTTTTTTTNLVPKGSQKRTSQNSSRSLSCCRHSIKQAREKFFNDTSSAFSPPTTPLPLAYQDHYRKFSQSEKSSLFPEVGTYTRKFKSNKISRGFQH